MKIQLNDSVIMLTAKSKVSEGEYFDALTLFARVDGYESMLNQIGCLCQLRDVGYALELYRMLLARYNFTHNCYFDVARLGSQVVDLLAYFDSELSKDVYDGSKLSANEQLLADFDASIDDYDDGGDYLDGIDMDEKPKRHFVDVKSTEYFHNLFSRMEDELAKGNLVKAKALIRQMLQFHSQDETVLEAQMFLCLAEQQYEKGAAFASKFAEVERAESYRGIGAAVELLSASEEHQATLNKMLARLVDFGEDITDAEMMDFVDIADSRSDNKELTSTLAKILYSHYKDAGCEALRVCARAFCNAGEPKLARDAVLTLLNAAPWDSYATAMLKYIDSDISTKLDTPVGNLTLVRHMDVPSQLAVIAEYLLIQRMDSEQQCVFTTDDYKLLHCISNACKSHVLRGNTEKFLNEATVFSTVLFSFEPQDKKEYYAFAKEQLCSFLPETSVQKHIMLKLIQLGYRDKLLMSVSKDYYQLDLSRLTVKDENFLNAFCLCAALRRVDARRLQRSYAKIKSAVQVPEEYTYDNSQQLAYCLLAVSYKDFVQSSASGYFSEGEDQLYLEYISATVNK